MVRVVRILRRSQRSDIQIYKIAEREASPSYYELWVIAAPDVQGGKVCRIQFYDPRSVNNEHSVAITPTLLPFLLEVLGEQISYKGPFRSGAPPVRDLSYLRDRVGEALESGVDLGGYYADEVWHGIRDSDWDEAEYRNAYTHGVGASDIPEECFRRDHGRVFSQDEITEAILEVVGPVPVLETPPGPEEGRTPVRLGALVERALNEGQRLGNYLLVNGEFMSAWNILWNPGEYRRLVQRLPIFLSGDERRFRHEHEPDYGQEAITEAVIQAIHDRQVPF